MKTIIALAFLFPFAAIAQSTSDYQNAMKKFQKLYNAGQGDSINAMFGTHTAELKAVNRVWSNESNRSILDEVGTLNSFRFIGVDQLDPSHVYVFETIFSKAGKKMTSLTLESNNALSTFRFITSSEGIDVLLKKQKGIR